MLHAQHNLQRCNAPDTVQKHTLRTATASGTLTFQCLLTSRLADLRSRCRMGGWHMCRYSMPLAASSTMLMRRIQSSCCCKVCRSHCHFCHTQADVQRRYIVALIKRTGMCRRQLCHGTCVPAATSFSNDTCCTCYYAHDLHKETAAVAIE